MPSPAGQPALIREVRARLERAGRIVALTGAGLCPDETVPAFSPCGTLLAGRSLREIACQEPFFEDPVAVWQWYDTLRARLAAVRPGAAHRALAELERRGEGFTLATECIDGLHRLAGSRTVLELRGNLWAVRCTRCGMRAPNREVPIPNPPSCLICTGLVRPDIVWRGERVHQELLIRCFEALKKCDVLLVAGLSCRHSPASSFIGVARKAGAFVVVVEPEPPPGHPAVDGFLVGAAEDILEQLVPPCA